MLKAVRDFQIQKYSIVLTAGSGESGAGSREAVVLRTEIWIIYFLEFPKMNVDIGDSAKRKNTLLFSTMFIL